MNNRWIEMYPFTVRCRFTEGRRWIVAFRSAKVALLSRSERQQSTSVNGYLRTLTGCTLLGADGIRALRAGKPSAASPTIRRRMRRSPALRRRR